VFGRVTQGLVLPMLLQGDSFDGNSEGDAVENGTLEVPAGM